MPVRNEDPSTLGKLTDLVNLEGIAEVVVVNCSDRHSTTDKLKELQSKFNSLRVINSEIAGRAYQMNQGGALASGSILWFIHADTSVPESSAEYILESISTEKPWGRFDIRFDNPSAGMKLVAFAINLRSGLTGVCSGDQAIFLLRSQFHKMGGFPNIPLLEDIALKKTSTRGSGDPNQDARHHLCKALGNSRLSENHYFDVAHTIFILGRGITWNIGQVIPVVVCCE